ncbi:MAG: antitoxin family protein [Desulfurococcales archaeon]|nr:antitoxin family protein [Desulfurococcales archaeon]
MSFTVRAKYEKGVLRPLENVNLKEGEEVIIINKEEAQHRQVCRGIGQGFS